MKALFILIFSIQLASAADLKSRAVQTSINEILNDPVKSWIVQCGFKRLSQLVNVDHPDYFTLPIVGMGGNIDSDIMTGWRNLYIYLYKEVGHELETYSAHCEVQISEDHDYIYEFHMPKYLVNIHSCEITNMSTGEKSYIGSSIQGSLEL